MITFRLLIAVLILVPQLTFASDPTALKNLVDDYNYSMSVEWDQTDKVFASQKEAELKENVSVLVEQGLTEADIRNAFPLIDVATLTSELSGVSDVSAYILKNHNRFYKKGASWNGEALIPYAITAVALTVMIYLIARAAKKGCEAGRAENPDFKCDT